MMILSPTNRGLIDPDYLVGVVQEKPDALTLILTADHEEPTYIRDAAHLTSRADNGKHPVTAGQRARTGTEYP